MTAVPEVSDVDGVDTIVVGPVYGTIEKIVAGNSEKVLRGQPVPVRQMKPASREYFETVPNIGGHDRGRCR